ncbi:hypothetical protein A2454_02780 [Candidatus Peribacteria bacterium RIFOXYC2_FULL_55_14]|nr:MAG: hypothetical protein UY85_C0010G0007 [Candidatus Peribacteria bacterium GW2011_GWB1_54_5]KKW41009.1 MAG: hypothetical protein UY87_C0006G0021 [Candidatus Peribacteria bacterium GW2011_GWC2_54_8]OGJ73733.1 MAG: hypothetical protein A2384_04105 [Candidatus Peribacteria bacterium RIFOXYB1_FULL_54_35]OGJ74861.1 MAG: hypothetical protein A2217_02575 [Candidatus Peribacteria bacterium RIFOXYA2_FULL_55_28]OGJ77149.1 MAG: hypothetical protein A2327_05680 [Candidatus Peribacteria bacterium RIFOX
MERTNATLEIPCGIHRSSVYTERRWMKKVFIPAIAALLLIPSLFLSGCGGNAEWREVKTSVLPQLMEGNLRRRLPAIVYEEISRDLSLGYVIDHDQSYNFIMKYNLEEWGINQKTLHRTAMKNLEKLVGNTEVQYADTNEDEKGRYAIIETGDGYDAVRILSPSLQKNMREYLGAEYIAGMPVRDFLIFWHKDLSYTSDFIEQVEKAYAEGDKYKLTPRLFLVTEDGLEPLTKRSVEQEGRE